MDDITFWTSSWNASSTPRLCLALRHGKTWMNGPDFTYAIKRHPIFFANEFPSFRETIWTWESCSRPPVYVSLYQRPFWRRWNVSTCLTPVNQLAKWSKFTVWDIFCENNALGTLVARGQSSQIAPGQQCPNSEFKSLSFGINQFYWRSGWV
jgi:hypothetical protein